ncbi:MAG: bifunctional nuclease family protein [Spirochaetaceae bacterium]|jgi:bifunctional DNase/RNase|nr:bifunctional nuclease family protein [Spirochaetaceae bacterium]
MENMLESEIWTIVRTGPSMAVLLRPRGYQVSVPIFIGHLEAHSILVGFGAAPRQQRPLTHDLMVSLIRHAGLVLARVEIYDIKNSAFLSRLFFHRNLRIGEKTSGEETGEKPLIVDSRPSDAVALAIRCKCPVFIAQRIVSDVGVPEEFFLGITDEAISPPPEPSANSRRIALQTELEDAVAQEEYERAAEIRDMLILMDREGLAEFPEDL